MVFPAVASDVLLTQIGGCWLIWGMLAVGLMVLAGDGGMVSLARITVAAVAGCVVVIASENSRWIKGFGWPWWVVMPPALALASALIGWIEVRTQGVHVIMITPAVATAATLFTRQGAELFHGFSGLSGLPAPACRGIGWRDPVPFHCLCLGAAALFIAAVRYHSHSTFGLTLQVTRDNPRRMRATDHDVTAQRVFAWTLAEVIAGTAGMLPVSFNRRISPGIIGVGAAINVPITPVIGGLKHPIGPFHGALR